jgi:hypothetical protein
MSNLLPVVIDSLRVSLTNAARVIVLREEQGERFLPIWIGPFEAESITIALQEIELARPQTHDLMKNIIAALKGRLLRIEISDLREDVFFATLVVEVGDDLVEIDSRPSDAIALAVRYQSPIWVSAEVMDMAGFLVDPDLGEAPVDNGGTEMTEPDEILDSEDRLSVFEDFLEDLHLDKPDGEDTPPEPPDQPDEPTDS